MKRNVRNPLHIVCAVTAASLCSALLLTAADPPPTDGQPGRAGRRTGGQAQRGGGGAGGAPMVLDDQQLQLYREAMQKNNAEVRKLDDKLRTAQKELTQAAIAEKFDENNVRTKAEAVAKIQVEITTLRAKALSSVTPTLKPEQREQLESSPRGAAMLFGGFGGGAGGGGGGGGNAGPGRRGAGGQ